MQQKLIPSVILKVFHSRYCFRLSTRKKTSRSEKICNLFAKWEKQFSHRETVSVGMIGAGSYAAKILSPAFSRANAKMTTICSQGGVSAARLAKKNGFENASTDLGEVLADKNTNAIVIATRHNSHAELTSRALSLGKHVFVEKPLALNKEELSQIKVAFINAQKSRMPKLMVGFNRRYAPLISDILRLVSSTKTPKTLIYTVNAGELPDEHWTLDQKLAVAAWLASRATSGLNAVYSWCSCKRLGVGGNKIECQHR